MAYLLAVVVTTMKGRLLQQIINLSKRFQISITE